MQVKNTALLLLGIMAIARADYERNPLGLGTTWDVGQLVKGTLNTGSNDAVPVENQFLTRSGIFLTESGTFNKRLDLKITLGALFWVPLPEAHTWLNRTIQSGAGIGQAQGDLKIGNVDNPVADLQFGVFPIKYNPDAKDLGEYLYRSGTYPGIIYTGGWSYLNSAAYLAQGLRYSMSHGGGLFSHSLTLTMERDLERNRDFDPGYLFTVKPAKFFEFGGGIVWAHAVPLKDDSALTPIKCRNAYNKKTGKALSSEEIKTGCTDDVASDTLGYYTFKGFKVAARMSFDFGTLLGMDVDQFKLYGEWALLGIKDYPGYYDKKSERMPIMIGLDIPTFKALDMLGVEVEYKKSRFRNNMFWVMDDQPLPIPLSGTKEDYTDYDVTNPKYTAAQADSLNTKFEEDDLHWAIYARKQITKGMTVHAQVASDHLRHYGLQIAPIPGYAPATERTKDWYYILRLEFGI
jgi:hypothetical protein